ncbi:MAG: hypothetical protein M1820_006155 [Bogoriella megaspora]|nr:MAG: hypothetical protein M1820_006155 [Bogoriella megaspora]
MDAVDSEEKRASHPYAGPHPPHQRHPHHPEPPLVTQQISPSRHHLPPPQPHPQSHPPSQTHPHPHYPKVELHSVTYQHPPPSYNEPQGHEPVQSVQLPSVRSSGGPTHGWHPNHSGYPRPVETTSQPPPDPYRRSSSTPSQGHRPPSDSLAPLQISASESHRAEAPSMNHHPYPAPPPSEHINGGPHTLPPPHYDHPSTPVGYAPSYSGGQGPYHALSYGPAGQFGSAPQRKKQVRATQACDACRQRKQKCNEERPCAFCSEIGIKCEYREVPPPKQDRTMMQVIEKLDLMAAKQETTNARLNDMQRQINLLRRGSSQIDVNEASSGSATAIVPPTSMHRSISREDTSSVELAHRPTKMEYDSGSPPIFNRVRSDIPSGTEGTGGLSGPRKLKPPTDELSIPVNHNTPAHNILRWKVLERLIDVDKILHSLGYDVEKKTYPQELEIKRGLLKLYGRSEGPQFGDYPDLESSDSPENASEADDASSNASAAAESPWGTGLSSPSNVELPMKPDQDLGGRNPDGTLRLDDHLIEMYYQSFVENIWVHHPCLTRRAMSTLIRKFKRAYSPVTGPTQINSPRINLGDIMMQEHVHPNKRRKTSHIGANGPIAASSPDSSSSRLKRQVPERSIGNAIVLLILALGKISKHKKPLPPLASDQISDQPYGLPRPAYMESPSYLAKPSPSASSHASYHSPTQDPTQLTPRSRTVSTDGHLLLSRDLGHSNLDRIPGLAYFAYATDILGNLQGGNDVPHVQAFILAAIYSAQLARVMDSWAWLCQATRACQVLIRMEGLEVKDDRGNGRQGPDSPRHDSIRCLYWACLQLEGDILAELDTLNPSGLYEFVERINYPKGVANEMSDNFPSATDKDMHLLCYSAQIHIRRMLNDVHTALYTLERTDGGWNSKIQDPNKNSYERLTALLNGWKNVLPPEVQWDEEKETQAGNMVEARLRAKYYGARYVLNRPYLFKLLDLNEQERLDATYGSTLWRASEICVENAIRSTLAFDGVIGKNVEDRLITTNIFGTAHAQFGNCLVLAATHKHPKLNTLIDRPTLETLLERTIKFLGNYEAHSPTLRADRAILRALKGSLDKDPDFKFPTSAQSSFGHDS